MSKQNKIKMTIPSTLLDVHGYPTEEWLDYIKNIKPLTYQEVIDFVNLLIHEGWYYNAGVLHRKYRNIQKLELHTCGWSGNEEIIEALLSNIHLTHFRMSYVQWNRGGHYYFEIVVN